MPEVEADTIQITLDGEPRYVSKDELETVTPVKMDRRGGKKYEYRYGFHEAIVDEVDSVSIPQVEIEHADEGMWWQYGDKVPVIITEDEVFVHVEDSGTEAQRQAYYALSYMESQGLVTGWRKI